MDLVCSGITLIIKQKIATNGFAVLRYNCFAYFALYVQVVTLVGEKPRCNSSLHEIDDREQL